MTTARAQLISLEHVVTLLAAVTPAVLRRAETLCRAGEVTVAQMTPNSADIQVRDNQQLRHVTVMLIAGRLTTLCECAQRDDGPCLHRVAALVALRQHMTSRPPQQWETLFAVPDRVRLAVAHTTSAHIVFCLHRGHAMGVGDDAWALVPFTATVRAGRQDWDGAEVRPLRAPPTPAGHPDASHRVLQAATLVCTQTVTAAQPAQRAWLYAAALELLAGQDVFLSSDLRLPVRVVGEIGDVQLSIDDDGADLVLHSIVHTAHVSQLVDTQRIVLPFAPSWLLNGATLVNIGEYTPMTEHLLQTPVMRVGAADRERFDQRLRDLVMRVPLCGSALRWDEMRVEPAPRVILGECDGQLNVQLVFGYGEHVLPFDAAFPSTAILHGSEELHLVRINRDIDAERAASAVLEQYALRLHEDGTYRPRRTMAATDFMLKVVAALATEGMEVQGESAITAVHMRLDAPHITVSVQSHIDWFDVAAVVNYGDLSVDLATIRRAVLKRERYVLLADGSLGLVSHELAQRLAPLFAMGQTHDATIRYATAQVGVVEQIVQEASVSSVDSTFEERRARLRLFEHIEPQPLPDGFRGSLRNYQKAGYDWLHFLNTYGFGGCLADDMGVGKTIQTLAFIQSMRERAPQANAILIVMPRSIVYNWQREASRFTPNLRLLTHIDQGRSKDTATFAQYDVILTTYGTMLRDIDMLTSYRFQYVILDESQAVKNPSAETARAVRRLQAERRLSLTGTPIENSAVELWSQFAFLNPGLLGSAETFRETFTREGEGRDEALKLLRRLTFPFILRRTKDQVAPDLPSRTERVLMNEMEPEQRRLYNAQRDHYRALLLGLIDSAGPQQARVKMLEGLLRLRQICNHPRLIDPSSAGVSGKFESLLATLEALQAAGHRALVFSQFVQMLSLVRAELDARGIAYAYLDGRTRDRQSIIDAFQRDNRYAFFLISLRAGGVGLNLTAADYVIHVDPWWNPAVEMQATDRSHRIGQTRPVMVYKMVVRDSVEEKILQLQDRKRELVRQLITPERGGLKTLTRDDVELLFT